MIFVARSQKGEGGEPIVPADSWFEEAEKQTDTAISDGENHKVTDLYKDDRLRAALEKLFKFKCAYCESPVGPANGMDVEHYRPKGRVAERKDHSGYYWLAYDWENLYLSCQLCNQRREDKPLLDEFTTLPSAGKQDQFPIEDESARAMAPGDPIENEMPLLLDPNIDDPELHITFDAATGEALALDPDDIFAVKTIEICNLNRRRLKKARLSRLSEVRRAIREFGTVLPDATCDQLFAAARNVFVKPELQYSACVRAALDDPDAFG